jgi:hypothetical protein
MSIMKRSVYIETTIPSFYYEVRSEPEMIARRESTRRWWTEEGPRYDLFCSAFVIGELQEGEYPGKEDALRLVAPLQILEIASEIEEIAQTYHRRQLMPLGDAYHLAVASFYGMHFVLTWNCRHLANANKVRHLQVVNGELGLPVPIVTTPDLLLTEVENDG